MHLQTTISKAFSHKHAKTQSCHIQTSAIHTNTDTLMLKQIPLGAGIQVAITAWAFFSSLIKPEYLLPEIDPKEKKNN